MKGNKKRLLFLGIVFLVAFAIWTALIQIVDVQPVGAKGTDIGFATFNCWFHELTGVHRTLYVVTDWMGLVPVFVCMLFGGVGFIQLVKRRSILKVDSDIMFLGIYYVIVILAYLLFEMLPINYRPVMIEGFLETSYPSSTTLLVLSVMPTLVEQMNRRIEGATVKQIVGLLTICFSMFMVTGRLVSGVHWFTDIVGSILLSAGFFFVYKAVVLSLGELPWNFMKNFKD